MRLRGEQPFAGGDDDEEKGAMLPTLRSKLLEPTAVEEANDRLFRYLVWQAFNGVAVMTYYVVGNLYITRLAGEDPVETPLKGLSSPDRATSDPVFS